MEKVVNIAGDSNANGHIEILKHMFSFVDSMVLKCAVDLQLADILHSNNGQPMSLSQIASHITTKSPNTSINQDKLERVMRMLVRLKIFSITTLEETTQNGGENVVLYGTTPSSMAILSNSETSLAQMILLEHYPLKFQAWHHMSDAVREGGSGFKKAHGSEIFEFTTKHPELNRLFNLAMIIMTNNHVRGILSVYKHGFSVESGVQTVVDVGGGVGHLIHDIVKEFPHIKGINFDLPHVVAMATESEGVTHVGGDVLKDQIPHGDLMILKHILHGYGNEDCIKILRNCKKSMKNDKAKMIIIDEILREEGDIDEFNSGNIDVIQDMLMLVMTHAGKEKTKKDFMYIVEEAGFKIHNFIKIPFVGTIIEVYPK